MCENNGLAYVSESNPIAHILDNMAPNIKKIFDDLISSSCGMNIKLLIEVLFQSNKAPSPKKEVRT
jgi:hypothetical protein